MVVLITRIHHESKVVTRDQLIFCTSPNFLDVTSHFVPLDSSTIMLDGNHDNTGKGKVILSNDKLHSSYGIRLTSLENQINLWSTS